MVVHNRKQRKTYDARVEFLAVREDVAQLLAEGHRIKAVFERLTQGGRITVCYTTFCDYIRGGGQRLRRKDQRRGQPAFFAGQPPQSS
ncbi:MAG: TraK family protein, partial [Candidatus Adiutrix sp.]|nr:TraK family protein [Candidatus Adiutrix sp.]